MVVVQVIRTTWTKASRGAPASTRRAAVPQVLALPGDAAPGPLGLVHEAEAGEADDFELRWRCRPAGDRLPLRAGGLRVDVDAAADTSLVTRLPEIWNGWPSRSRSRVAFRLRPGQWGQAVRNNRHGAWKGWTYTKTVVNVANLPAFDHEVFLRSAPAHVLDEQASLR